MHIEQAITESAEELRRLAEQHGRLLEAAVRGDGSGVSEEACISVNCPCRKVLRGTLHETIAALDETRRSFKSRKLADLRRMLMKVLADEA